VDHCKVPVENGEKRGEKFSALNRKDGRMHGIHQLDECPITLHPGSFIQMIFHMA